MTHPFDLRTAIDAQGWAWLLDLPHRLNVAIEIVDGDGVPMLPAGSDETAGAVRGILAAKNQPLAAAISRTSLSNSEAVAIDRVLCVCLALSPAGILIVGREVTEHGDAGETPRRDLESIGSWLRGAINANLASAPSGAADSHLVASLQRLLREAVARGSARGVVSAFVETLGVWLDLDVRGYVADAHGQFFRSVSPLGADPSAMPESFDTGIPADMALIRLTGSECERLGFASTNRDVLIRRIFMHSGASWLLAFCGAIDLEGEPALIVYSDLLRESLNDLIDETNDRVVAAIMPHLSHAHESVEKAARLALDEIVAAVGARRGALVVVTADGKQPLAVGSTELIGAVAPDASDRLLVRTTHDGDLIALAVAEGATRFTAHDRDVVEAALALLQPWAWAVLHGSEQCERRSAHLPFQTWIEQRASETVQEGGHASVIVISIPDAALRPGFMQAQVGRIRNQLRPSDFAGNLAGDEIAVLLPDTGADQAAFVSARLRKLLEPEDSGNEGVVPTIGVISCSADRPLEGSIIHAARENAAGASPLDRPA